MEQTKKASEKQLALMDKLKISYPRDVSSKEAYELISENLNQEEKKEKPFVKNGSYTAMYVSYVKDLIIAGKDPLDAVRIIKQTIKEFE